MHGEAKETTIVLDWDHFIAVRNREEVHESRVASRLTFTGDNCTFHMMDAEAAADFIKVMVQSSTPVRVLTKGWYTSESVHAWLNTLCDGKLISAVERDVAIAQIVLHSPTTIAAQLGEYAIPKNQDEVRAISADQEGGFEAARSALMAMEKITVLKALEARGWMPEGTRTVLFDNDVVSTDAMNKAGDPRRAGVHLDEWADAVTASATWAEAKALLQPSYGVQSRVRRVQLADLIREALTPKAEAAMLPGAVPGPFTEHALGLDHDIQRCLETALAHLDSVESPSFDPVVFVVDLRRATGLDLEAKATDGHEVDTNVQAILDQLTEWGIEAPEIPRSGSHGSVSTVGSGDTSMISDPGNTSFVSTISDVSSDGEAVSGDEADTGASVLPSGF